MTLGPMSGKLDRRVYIKESALAGAGKGLFAKKSISKGENLPVVGILVRRNSVEDRCTRYADAYKFRVGKFLLIPLNHTGLINHSRAPNLKKIVTGKTVHLKALRAIRAGEELFFRYSRYAQKRFRLRADVPIKKS